MIVQQSLKVCVLASHNQKKVQELQLLLGDVIALSTLADHGIESPIEDGLTFVENALIKARVAARATGLSALADDSGLVVPALDGQPGLYSARYAFEGATDEDNNIALIRALQRRDLSYADAYYNCTLVFIRHGEDPDPMIAQGRWHGRIYPEPKGVNGFGYDPLFYIGPHYEVTAAQLEPQVKASQSHRGIAIRSLQSILNAQCILDTTDDL